MSAPRITLWTNPFKMPLRLSTGTFKSKIVSQVNDIQKLPPQTIEITPGALYILSCVAGRRMAEPVRWVLFDSLRDILNGKLRTLHPEKQDLLAGTFGELIGVVILALQLGGEGIEIIRLLESQEGKMPDFLLLERTPYGQYTHILECKGQVVDVNNMNARISGRGKRKRQADFDLCSEQQEFRAAAIKQIDDMDVGNMKSGGRTVLGRKIPFGLSYRASTKNIIISSVSDGRILWLYDPALLFATRRECKGRNVSCNVCIENNKIPLSADSSLANVISVLYREAVAKGSPLEQGVLDFLTRYRTASRAAWSGHEPFFGASLNEFIEQLLVPEIGDMRPTTLFMSITLIEAAIFDELVHFNFEKSEQTLLVQSSNSSHGLQEVLRRTLDKFRAMRRLSRKRVEIVQGIAQSSNPDEISNGRASEKFTSSEPENRNIRWDDFDQGLERIVQFSREKGEQTLLVQRTIPEMDDTVYGSAYFEDPFTLVLHLSSAKKKPSALKEYMEALIARFRLTKYQKLDWREEYFSNDVQKRVPVGASWDMYPYPNSRNGFPGITAWFAEDGRAEVIIRILE